MRSAQDVRQRWPGLVTSVMERTGMYATTRREMQPLAGQLLADPRCGPGWWIHSDEKYRVSG